MIENKQQLKTIMHMDKRALGMKKKHPSLVGDDIWKFEIVLRKHEYYSNKKSFFMRKIYGFFAL